MKPTTNTPSMAANPPAMVNAEGSARQAQPVARHNQRVGRDGEDFAAAYVEQLGWRVLSRNWRCRDGEIDLIAADGRTIVIIEVKARTSAKYGRAIEAVTAEKLSRLRGLGARWAHEHDARAVALRIDVIGLERHGDQWTIDHRRGVQA